MEFISWYISVGLAIYIVSFAANYEKVRKQQPREMLHDFLSLVVWPHIVWIWAKMKGRGA